MELEPLWEVTERHFAEDGKPIAIEVEDPDGWMFAKVRWDGCMEIHVRTITDEGNHHQDVLHTCDLPGMIDKLTQLRDVCMHQLGRNGYWAAYLQVTEGRGEDPFLLT